MITYIKNDCSLRIIVTNVSLTQRLNLLSLIIVQKKKRMLVQN